MRASAGLMSIALFVLLTSVSYLAWEMGAKSVKCPPCIESKACPSEEIWVNTSFGFMYFTPGEIDEAPPYIFNREKMDEMFQKIEQEILKHKRGSTMKKLIAVCALFALVAGCSGFQLTDDANTQAIAYASGKATGYAVNKFAPKADAPLSEAWVGMMTTNAVADPIPASSIVAFYQQAIMLLAQQSADPYGLVSDLTMLLSIYGGVLTGDGTLILAQPIPLKVALAFELGYKSGKSAVQGFSVQRQVP